MKVWYMLCMARTDVATVLSEKSQKQKAMYFMSIHVKYPE